MTPLFRRPNHVSAVVAVAVVVLAAGCAAEKRFFAGRLPYGFSGEETAAADPFGDLTQVASADDMSRTRSSTGRTMTATEQSLAALRKTVEAPAVVPAAAVMRQPGPTTHSTSSPAMGLGGPGVTWSGGAAKPVLTTTAAPKTSAPMPVARRPDPVPVVAAMPTSHVARKPENPFATLEAGDAVVPASASAGVPSSGADQPTVMFADFTPSEAATGPSGSVEELDESLWEPVPSDGFVLPTR